MLTIIFAAMACASAATAGALFTTLALDPNGFQFRRRWFWALANTAGAVIAIMQVIP